MKNILIAFAASAVALSIAPAHATSSSDQISLCKSAVEVQGLAPADAFKLRFVNIKGAALKTVTFKASPITGGEDQIVECRIRGGNVIEAAVKP